jgi:hypothetical protein
MRWLFVVTALVGCAPRVGDGPAWPRQHFTDADGGESISPHQPRQTVVAAPRVEEAKPAVAKPTIVPAATPAVEALPPVISPTAQPTEETITTEDIIIEIDD